MQNGIDKIAMTVMSQPRCLRRSVIINLGWHCRGSLAWSQPRLRSPRTEARRAGHPKVSQNAHEGGLSGAIPAVDCGRDVLDSWVRKVGNRRVHRGVCTDETLRGKPHL